MRRAILWAITGILVAGIPGLGQSPRECRGVGPAAMAGGQTVELKGKVVAVHITPGEGMPFVTVKTGDRVVTVYLGSMRHLMMRGFNPKVDENIVVKAYKMKNDFVAASVTLPAANQTLRLRDECGWPMWRGGPRGMPFR